MFCWRFFFDFREVVDFEYLALSLTRLRDVVRHKKPELRSKNLWILHDDNVPLHRAWIGLDYLTEHQVNTIKQLQYLPDLVLYKKIYVFNRDRS